MRRAAQSSPYAGPDHPGRLGAAQSAVSQAPAASPRSTGQGPPGHRVAPSPALAALLSSAGLKSLAHLCQGQSGQEPGPPGPRGPQPFSWWGGSGGGWKWGEPPGHPALDGKSSRGRSEETSPEKVQRAREAAEGRAARRWCSTEDPASTPPDSQGSSAPCTTVGSPQFILSTGRLHPSPCVGGTWWPTRLSRP